MRVRVPPSAPSYFVGNELSKIFFFSLKQVFLAIVLVVSVKPQTVENPYILPKGTVILTQLDNSIGSGFSSANDTFTLTVLKPIIIEQAEVLPEGTTIEGKILEVKRASLGNKSGKIVVKIETLRLPNGNQRTLDAQILDLPEIESKTVKRLVLSSAIASAIGSTAGSLTGQRKYILLGLGAGVIVGTSITLLQKGEDIFIKSGEQLKIRLNKELILPSQDF